MPHPRPHPSPFRETRPENRMSQPPGPQHVHAPPRGPVVERIPVGTLVRGAEVAERDRLRVAPAHGDEGDVRVAGEGREKGGEAVVWEVSMGRRR